MHKFWAAITIIVVSVFMVVTNSFAVVDFILPGTALYMRTHIQYQSLAKHDAERTPIIPSGSFALAMTTLGTNIPAGSLYPAVQIGNDIALQLPNGSTIKTAPGNVKLIAVPTGTKSMPILRQEHLVLGFADSSQTGYIQNVNQDPLSVFAPDSYELANTSGNIKGALPESVVKSAHAQHIQVWAMVFSGFHPARTNDFLSSPSAEFHFLQNLIGIIKNTQVDGINFDFEDMVPADASRYTTFIQSATTLLHAMGKWVSVDVTVPTNDPNWGLVYQRQALAETADYIVGMTYDESYLGEQTSGSVAAIPWMESGVQALLQDGVPAAKLLLGIPYYTINWYQTTNHEMHSQYVLMNQESVLKQLPGAQISYDPASGQHILTYSQNGQLHKVWLEDSTSLTSRAAYAKSDNLAGVAIWQLAFGTPSDLATILKAL